MPYGLSLEAGSRKAALDKSMKESTELLYHYRIILATSYPYLILGNCFLYFP